jgi:head-tail adaptor
VLNLGRLVIPIVLENPAPPVSDGKGGYTEEFFPLDPPRARASIRWAGGRGERTQAGTIESQATPVVRMRYHPGVTVKTRITFVDRSGTTRYLSVVDVTDPDELGVELELTCSEVTPE